MSRIRHALDGSPAGRDRLWLAAALDPFTTTSLLQVGIRRGARVLDVGTGCGTVAAWLAEVVGPEGQVTATELDVSLVNAGHGVTVLSHDITCDPLDDESFDLIHARLVLMHLPERVAVVHRLAAALKPGGVLVLHEFDHTWPCPVHQAPTASDADLFAEVGDGINQLLDATGTCLDWGVRAHAVCVAAGLSQVTTQVHATSFRGGGAWARKCSADTIIMSDRLLAFGLTANQLDRYRHLMASPEFVATTSLLTRTVGQAVA